MKKRKSKSKVVPESPATSDSDGNWRARPASSADTTGANERPNVNVYRRASHPNPSLSNGVESGSQPMASTSSGIPTNNIEDRLSGISTDTVPKRQPHISSRAMATERNRQRLLDARLKKMEEQRQWIRGLMPSLTNMVLDSDVGRDYRVKKSAANAQQAIDDHRGLEEYFRMHVAHLKSSLEISAPERRADAVMNKLHIVSVYLSKQKPIRSYPSYLEEYVAIVKRLLITADSRFSALSYFKEDELELVDAEYGAMAISTKAATCLEKFVENMIRGGKLDTKQAKITYTFVHQLFRKTTSETYGIMQLFGLVEDGPCEKLQITWISPFPYKLLMILLMVAVENSKTIFSFSEGKAVYSSVFTSFSQTLSLILRDLHRLSFTFMRQMYMPYISNKLSDADKMFFNVIPPELIIQFFETVIKVSPYSRLHPLVHEDVCRLMNEVYRFEINHAENPFVGSCYPSNRLIAALLSYGPVKKDRMKCLFLSAPGFIIHNYLKLRTMFEDEKIEVEEMATKSSFAPLLVLQTDIKLTVKLLDLEASEDTKVLRMVVLSLDQNTSQSMEVMELLFKNHDMEYYGFAVDCMSLCVVLLKRVKHIEDVITRGATRLNWTKSDTEKRMEGGIFFRGLSLVKQILKTINDVVTFGTMNEEEDSVANTCKILLNQLVEILGALERVKAHKLLCLALDCVAEIGPSMWGVVDLSMLKNIANKVLEYTSSTRYHMEVVAKAGRTLAFLCRYEQLLTPYFIRMMIKGVADACDSSNYLVRLSWTWAFGEFMQALMKFAETSSKFKLPKDLVFDVFEIITVIAKDAQNLRYNAYRASGNFLKILPPGLIVRQVIKCVDETIKILVDQLGTGLDYKSRWNAAYALGCFFENEILVTRCATGVRKTIIKSLCGVIVESGNWKEKAQAAIAIRRINRRDWLGDDFIRVWERLWRSVEKSTTDWLEDRQMLEKFQTEVLLTIGVMASMLEPGDLPSLAEIVARHQYNLESLMSKITKLVPPEVKNPLLMGQDRVMALSKAQPRDVTLLSLKSIFNHLNANEEIISQGVGELGDFSEIFGSDSLE